MSTEIFIAFKGIYLASTEQYFLCDFYRARNGDSYRILAELPGKELHEIHYPADPENGGFVCTTYTFSALFYQQLELHIAQLEQQAAAVGN